MQGVSVLKIHIVGCSGSGKTYLAEALSRKYGIPHFDLDDIQWDNRSASYGTKMPKERRSSLLSEILENKNWVIEGVYHSWVEECFIQADVIYVLALPGYVCRFRIIRRFLRRKLGLEKGKRETLSSVLGLLRWTDTFQKQNLKEIQKMLEKYDDKSVWLRSRREIRRSAHILF